ncbi:MAG: GIY-YIG nuclease family protein [Candidatus Paceibacterota bacterium]
MNLWFVYILKCSDGTLYTGITTDVDRRLAEHQAGTASKYTSAKGAEKMVYVEEVTNRSAASAREAEIKKLSRPQKERLIS